MNLKIQIISFLFSFLYGVFFSFLFNLHYQFLFYRNKIIQVIITLLFLLDMALLYFLVLQMINNGIVHVYFYFLLFLGFYTTFSFFKKFRKK